MDSNQILDRLDRKNLISYIEDQQEYLLEIEEDQDPDLYKINQRKIQKKEVFQQNYQFTSTRQPFQQPLNQITRSEQTNKLQEQIEYLQGLINQNKKSQNFQAKKKQDDQLNKYIYKMYREISILPAQSKFFWPSPEDSPNDKIYDDSVKQIKLNLLVKKAIFDPVFQAKYVEIIVVNCKKQKDFHEITVQKIQAINGTNEKEQDKFFTKLKNNQKFFSENPENFNKEIQQTEDIRIETLNNWAKFLKNLFLEDSQLFPLNLIRRILTDIAQLLLELYNSTFEPIYPIFRIYSQLRFVAYQTIFILRELEGEIIKAEFTESGRYPSPEIDEIVNNIEDCVRSKWYIQNTELLRSNFISIGQVKEILVQLQKDDLFQINKHKLFLTNSYYPVTLEEFKNLDEEILIQMIQYNKVEKGITHYNLEFELIKQTFDCTNFDLKQRMNQFLSYSEDMSQNKLNKGLSIALSYLQFYNIDYPLCLIPISYLFAKYINEYKLQLEQLNFYHFDQETRIEVGTYESGRQTRFYQQFLEKLHQNLVLMKYSEVEENYYLEFMKNLKKQLEFDNFEDEDEFEF